MRNPEPFIAQGEIPAGSDAAKGFFFFGVSEGRILTISALSYWGGDTGENYQMVIVPAGEKIKNVSVAGSLGMFSIGSPAKGGSTETYQALWNNNAVSAVGNLTIPGPCSVVIASTNAANAAAFYSGVYGVMHDL